MVTCMLCLVQTVEDQQETSKWPRISVRMVVEVHCIPTGDINWSNALPWIISPPNIIFIQPHGFLKETYVPLAIEGVDWVEVNFGDRDDYGGNIATVDLGYHDFEETKEHYTHSMEITVYQPRILVEYCDLMTSISTVSQGFLFCCIFKISQPVS